MKLLDTSVLIEIDIGGKGVLEKAKELDAEGRHAISTISLYEFYLGIYRKYKIDSRKYNEAVKKAELLLLRFFVLTITPEIAIRAARIGTTLTAKGEEIGVNDNLHCSYGACAQSNTINRRRGAFQEDRGVNGGRVVKG